MRKDAMRAYAEQRRIGWEMKAKRVIHPAWVCFALVMGAWAVSVIIRALVA
jgi:hypothetical protein